VAGEQGGSRPAEPGGRGAPALRDDVDPLGPPQPRPPIDLSRLDTPLGPPPPLPARTDAGAATEAPRRLPRRHEVHDGATARPSTPRLPRAVEQLAGAAGDGRSERPRGEIRPVRLERDRDRPASTAATGRRRSAGPPAPPLLVLIRLRVGLPAGLAWLGVTGAARAPTP